MSDVKKALAADADKEQKDDWLAGSTRSRNTLVITLTEGDILIIDDEYNHVSSGEISVYADGTVDKRSGELEPVSQEAVTIAIARHKTIFNLEDAV